MTPGVSIVVPTLNAMASLPALLDAIDEQDDDDAREVIVVDSGSTDGTAEYVMRRLGGRIDVERFNHGTTRNTAVSHTRAPLIVLTVQDARPVTRGWLAELLRPLRGDVWVRHPFAATPIAEDLEWSRDVLLAGYRIAYEPSSVVEHSHDRPARYELARTWALHQRLHHLFGVRTIASLPALLHSLGSTAACHRRLLREAGITTGQRGWLRATALGIAWPLGQFVGGWTAAHGRDRWRPGGV